MSLKLERLPDNLISIGNKIFENENIVKMINDNSKTPLSSTLPPDPKTLLFLKRVFPYPYSEDIVEQQTQIRFYYPSSVLKNGGFVENTDVHFDIIVHKELFLMKDLEGKTTFRPDEIAKELISVFDDKSIDTIGKLHFRKRVHLPVNTEYQMIRLIASMMTLNNGRR